MWKIPGTEILGAHGCNKNNVLVNLKYYFSYLNNNHVLLETGVHLQSHQPIIFASSFLLFDSIFFGISNFFGWLYGIHRYHCEGRHKYCSRLSL